MRHNQSTHGGDGLIRLEVKGGPQIQFTDGFEALSPVHVPDDMSPGRCEIVVVFTFLQGGGVRGTVTRVHGRQRTPIAPT
jgi:hypothetical protein